MGLGEIFPICSLSLVAEAEFSPRGGFATLAPALPKPSTAIYSGEPRIARWHKVKKLESVDPRSEIDSAAKYFLWRLYAIDTVKNWDMSKFYKEKEEYMVVGPKMGREIMIFARLIRASELVGMDCVDYTIPEDDLELSQSHLLKVDNRVVLAAKSHIHFIVTSADVPHSWAVPSSGVKCDAVPGRGKQTAAQRLGLVLEEF
ncbi:hypothetical protein HAX54_010704 [Datura stramonium]|uniref:Cytochrome c oxidase polypeptide II n=1 Tax=Datura stramonium TaxID=4076 RepID=A0ABS8TGS1_DATST|nr:hypothetical protein [Datura stramonium]